MNDINSTYSNYLALANSYGTPLYVFDEGKLRENYQLFSKAFESYPESIICYSIKSNYNLSIVSTLKEEGAYAEVASGLDMHVALKVGYSGDKIIYDGPFKSYENLCQAIENRTRIINIESLSEIDCIEKAAEKLKIKQPVGIRVNLFKPPRNPFKRFLNPEWLYDFPGIRFGFPPEQVVKVARHIANCEHLELCGLMTHPYHGAASPLIALARELREQLRIEVNYINLGGGFRSGSISPQKYGEIFWDALRKEIGLTPSTGVKNTSRKGSNKDIKEVAKHLIMEIRTAFEENRLDEKTLVFEPGSFLVADAGVLLLRVVSVKDRGGTKWVLTDGGTNIFSTMGRHKVQLIGNCSTSEFEQVNITGCMLYDRDIIALRVMVPKIKEGDLLVVHAVGAYSLSRSNQFLYPRPAVLMIRMDGEITIIRRSESYDDVISCDTNVI